MSRLSVVIPSKTHSNIQPCIAAILAHDPTLNIIVVNDGIVYPNSEARMFIQSHCTVVQGDKPFCFAQNVNLGIQAAATDSCLILNDDALLETHGGFTMIQQIAEAHSDYGIISSACNNVGNRNQWQQAGGTLRDEPRMVCFTCVLIPRRTIDTVGLLDERFLGYGLDDDDYSLRVRKAGLKIGIYDGCFVDHSKLKSSFREERTGNNAPGDFRPNMKLFIEKWGVDNWGKGWANSEFADLFPEEMRR